MSRKIIDLSLGNAPTLDLSVFFPSVYAHTDDTPGNLPPFTDISREHEATIDLGEEYFVKIDPFRTSFTLDLARPGIIHVPLWKMWFGERPRLRTINLTPKLSIPYGALDIRDMEAVTFSVSHIYPDLFRRSLPLNLQITHFLRIHTILWKRIGIGITMIILSIVLLGIPFMNYLKHSFIDAEMRLKRITHATSNSAIQDDVLAVRATFERANIFLKPVFLLLDNPLIHIDRIESAHALIDAGLATTRALDSVIRTLPPNFTYIPKSDTGSTEDQSLTPNYRAPARDILLLERYGILSPTLWYKENTPAIRTAIEEMEKTALLLGRFTTTGDRGSDKKIIDIRETLGHLTRYGRFFLEHETDMLRMLGDTEPMKYIVFNQNRDEIRANGGFPGTVFTFTLYKGNILDYRKDDVYYYDWNLFPHVEVPPAGLEQFGNFGLRDVTYYPLFRDSLEKANSFIEKSGETSITNGIAINQGLIEDILAVTGPVTLSGIAEPFTEKNFSSLMSTLVEAKYAKVKTPKDVLFEFVDALEKKVLSEGMVAPVLTIIERNLKNGQIILRSRDDATDRFLLSFGVFDTFVADKNNWVYPIFTNVGGNKSDRFITRSYDRSATLLSGCTVENILILRSRHSFSGAEEKLITNYMDMLGITDVTLRNKLLTIEGKGLNKAFVRIVVPFGSRLIGENIDVKTDNSRFDYTTFSFNLSTPIGGESEKTIHYTTKPNICTATGTIYHQPGLRVSQ